MSKPIRRAGPLHSTDLTAPLSASEALAILEDIHSYLLECSSVSQLLKLRNQAEAIRLRLKSDAIGLDVINRAAIVRIHCEHRAGTILKQLVKRGGNHRGDQALPRSQLQELARHKKQNAVVEIASCCLDLGG
jgi:hypothetical protein